MSKRSNRIEVLTGVERRRRHSVGDKLRILQEASQPGMTVSYVACNDPLISCSGVIFEKEGNPPTKVGL